MKQLQSLFLFCFVSVVFRQMFASTPSFQIEFKFNRFLWRNVSACLWLKYGSAIWYAFHSIIEMYIYSMQYASYKNHIVFGGLWYHSWVFSISNSSIFVFLAQLQTNFMEDDFLRNFRTYVWFKLELESPFISTRDVKCNRKDHQITPYEIKTNEMTILPK